MKKLLILALTSAFVAAANADNWFSVAVRGSTQTTTGALWSTEPAAADVANGVISIDADEAITLSPTATKPSPEVNTVVTVEATFTAISDVPEDLTGATTALTVAKENNVDYYFYWDGDSWEKITGVVPTLNTPVEVRIELDNSTVGKTTATIKVGGTLVATVEKSSETVLGSLAFAGTGSLGDIEATVTPAYATKTVNDVTTRYATIADAGEGDITLYKHNGSFGTMPTVEGKLYFPINVIDNRASLYSFNKATEDNVDYYQIATAADLKALVDLTAYDNTARKFKQTANITLDAAWPGIGIQNGKDLVSYEVGTGDGKITQTEADKRDAAWNKGAFKGTYDGGNYTISNFQMIGKGDNAEGLDYCGFFNSVDGATIKNLKIQYAGALFAADTTANTKESGATFVGVAKNSMLQYLTSLQKDANTAVSCSKGFGGIVGYTTSGTTVDSCTNNVNMTSLAGNKCGGIAMITQKGSAVTIRNCQNNGTTTGNATQKGGIVGYVGVATEIADCEDTAGSDPSFLHHETGTLTMTGVNKAPAGVKSYTKNKTNIDGLNLATVSGNVATFVADDALKAGNTYKVMGPTATATYAFTAPGSISFDTSLATPTYAITAATGLVATPSTSGSNNEVKTYTAAWQTFTITWKNYDGMTLDTTTVDYNTTPTYDGETPTKAATAQYSYTFSGWTPTPGPVTADATYTATFTESVNNVTFTVAVPANTVVTVDGVEYTAGTQLSKPYGTEVTITYTPADGYIGESKTQTITVAGDTETISAPSTYVAPVPAVAKIGSTYYATLADAIGDAADSATVTLLDNVTLAEALNLELGNKAVTLDLGAKTLTGRTNLKSGSLTIKNGTVAGGSQQALNVYGSADSTAQNYSVLTIASDVNVTADVYGVCMFGATAGSNGYGAVVNIAGRVTTTGTGKEGAVFVSGNLGQNVSGDAHNVINVTGTITSATDAAIALNGLATVNVSAGAEVTGNTAIAVKRGTLNIQGGTVHATGAKNYPGTPNYNGTEMTGAAISVSDTYSKYGAMGANVTGGTITSDNADAIYKKDGDYKADAPIAVSGGTFSSSVPVEFCAAGFIPAQSGSTYGVEAGWKITWDVDGVKKVDTVKNGENLAQPADPTKSGYEFKGWTPDVVVKPVADATYTATWEQTAVPVVSTAETTLVAVPANCTAATLIDLSNRAAGDELKVYVSSVGKYYAWKLTGKPLAWSPMNVASGEGASATVEESPAADTVPLRRGQAAWVTRTTSSNILLKGQYSADDLTVSVEKGWNLVAPTTEESFSLNSITPPNDGDKIVVPQTTALRKIYTYDATKKQWGYTDSRKIDSFKGKDVVETFINYEDATIPVGTGFWYVTDANEDVQLQKKGNE